MADLRLVLESIDNLASFATLLDESRASKKKKEKQAAYHGSREAKRSSGVAHGRMSAAVAAARAAAAGADAHHAARAASGAAHARVAGQSAKRHVRKAKHAPALALRQARAAVKKAKSYEKTGKHEKVGTRKQKKQSKTYNAPTKKHSERGKNAPGDFSNKTTFKAAPHGGSHDPGGALTSTPGLRRVLSKDHKKFLSWPTGSERGRYPFRVKNRASLAGMLRQASKRNVGIYRDAVEKIKASPENMMHRKNDPSTLQAQHELPRPLGGKRPVRPHGHGGMPPSPGPHLKAPKKETQGRETKHEVKREHGRKRVDKSRGKAPVAP